METSNQIWVLISSLNTQERLYFRRDYIKANFGTDHAPLYLQVFDVISKMNAYDEEELLRKLSPAVNKKNISTLKNYLVENISNALVELHHRNDVGALLFRKLTLVKIYRSKNLIVQARKISESLMQKAVELENYPLLQQVILELQKILWYETQGTTHTEINAIIERAKKLLDESSLIMEFQDLYYKALLLKRRTHFKPNFEELNELIEINVRLLKHKLSNDSAFLLLHFYRVTKAVILYMQGSVTANEYAYENACTWQSNVNKIKEDSENYIEALYIYIYTAIVARDYENLMTIVCSDVHNCITNRAQLDVIETIKHLALNRIYNKTAKYDKVSEVIAIMKKQEPLWSKSIHAEIKITLYLSIGVSSFVLQAYDDAYYYIKNASYFFTDQTRKEHLSFAFLFLLIVCYEKRDYYLFDNQYHNTYNFFYKREPPQPFEKWIMQTLHKTINPANSKENIQLLNQLLIQLNENKDDLIQQGVFSIFNIPLWLQSKVEKVSYKSKVIEKLSVLVK